MQVNSLRGVLHGLYRAKLIDGPFVQAQLYCQHHYGFSTQFKKIEAPKKVTNYKKLLDNVPKDYHLPTDDLELVTVDRYSQIATNIIKYADPEIRDLAFDRLVRDALFIKLPLTPQHYDDYCKARLFNDFYSQYPNTTLLFNIYRIYKDRLVSPEMLEGIEGQMRDHPQLADLTLKTIKMGNSKNSIIFLQMLNLFSVKDQELINKLASLLKQQIGQYLIPLNPQQDHFGSTLKYLGELLRAITQLFRTNTTPHYSMAYDLEEVVLETFEYLYTHLTQMERSLVYPKVVYDLIGTFYDYRFQGPDSPLVKKLIHLTELTMERQQLSRLAYILGFYAKVGVDKAHPVIGQVEQAIAAIFDGQIRGIEIIRILGLMRNSIYYGLDSLTQKITESEYLIDLINKSTYEKLCKSKWAYLVHHFYSTVYMLPYYYADCKFKVDYSQYLENYVYHKASSINKIKTLAIQDYLDELKIPYVKEIVVMPFNVDFYLPNTSIPTNVQFEQDNVESQVQRSESSELKFKNLQDMERFIEDSYSSKSVFIEIYGHHHYYDEGCKLLDGPSRLKLQFLTMKKNLRISTLSEIQLAQWKQLPKSLEKGEQLIELIRDNILGQ